MKDLQTLLKSLTFILRVVGSRKPKKVLSLVFGNILRDRKNVIGKIWKLNHPSMGNETRSTIGLKQNKLRFHHVEFYYLTVSRPIRDIQRSLKC